MAKSFEEVFVESNGHHSSFENSESLSLGYITTESRIKFEIF